MSDTNSTSADAIVQASLPTDWGWCGGCGTSIRALTDAEARAILDTAAAWTGPANDLLAALAWPMEIFARGLDRPCVCQPAPWVPPTEGFYLYRLWSETDRLVYVGVSMRLRARLQSHRRRWPDLWTRATWDEHPDERAMLDAERAAIRDEDPALNRALVG